MKNTQRMMSDLATTDRREIIDNAIRDRRIRNDQSTRERRYNADKNVEESRLRNDEITADRRERKDRDHSRSLTLFTMFLLAVAVVVVGAFLKLL